MKKHAKRILTHFLTYPFDGDRGIMIYNVLNNKLFGMNKFDILGLRSQKGMLHVCL